WQLRRVGPIVASPVVAGDMVLVADAAKSLWALDLATGRARWALALPDVVSATPAVVGRTAVVPTDDLRARDPGDQAAGRHAGPRDRRRPGREYRGPAPGRRRDRVDRRFDPALQRRHR